MVVSRKKLLGGLLGTVILMFITLFFSYRLLEVPTGLTVDEGAFGYNAALLARTGRDQNDRFLPLFVLSIDGKDWRQPVTQYYLTAFFKIFGTSVFNLKFSSVIITVISAVLLFILAGKLFKMKWALMSVFVFLTTPLVMMQSHMALDNIMPIPFTIIWLLGIYLFSKTKKRKYLLTAALSLGVNFYSYKAMRAAVPVWVLISIGYIIIYHYKDSWVKTFKLSFRDVMVFSFGILPFFAIIPLLQKAYPGAVFGGQRPSFDSFYNIVSPYLSSFDPSFMYVLGDLTKYHSTQQHGMMLLASAPLFFSGLYFALKRKGFWIFILICYFAAPLFFGLVGSTHRASRLMMMIPLYSLLAALGAEGLWENRPRIYFKSSVVIILLLMIINYADFINYYWFTYPKFTQEIFGHLENNLSYKKLAEEAQTRNFTAYVAKDVYESDGESGHFYEAIYFETPTIKIDQEAVPPPKSILMTRREKIPEMRELPLNLEYRFQIRE